MTFDRFQKAGVCLHWQGKEKNMNNITQPKTASHTEIQAGVWKFILGMLLSVLSGLLLLLSFPPYGLWPLAWVALVPAIFAQYRLLPLKWSRLAGGLYVLLWLGPYLARLFGTQFGPFFTYLGVLIAIFSFFFSSDRKFHEVTNFRWFVLMGMFGWVGIEMIRATFIPLVATSAFIGYTQSTQAWIFQPVAIFSVYGFNLVIILVNHVLAQAVLAWYDKKMQPAEVHVDGGMSKCWLVGAGIVLAAWIGLSLVMLNSTPKDTTTIRVAALRSGFPLPAFQDEVNDDQVRFDIFAQQAREAAAQGAQALFTSEMMFNFDPQQKNTEEFKAIARETNTYLFLGYTVIDDAVGIFRNEIVMLSPSGEFSAVYAKNHNTPGEPLSPTAGVYPVYETTFGKMASSICHDNNYTDVDRKLAANGAQLIGAGFREFGGGGGEQSWQNVTFRAVENHTAIVMTGAAYVSAIIDGNGRQIALDTTYEGSPLVMVADVPMGSGATAYTAIGDVLGWVALAGLAFFTVFSSMAVKRAEKAK
jgi:apolipoprotein N-acyltransferase